MQESELRRIIVVEGDRQSELGSHASNLRHTITELELPRTQIADPRVVQTTAYRAAMAREEGERAGKIREAKNQLKKVEDELDSIGPKLRDARKEISALDGRRDTERRLRCAKVVEEAVKKCGASREAYLAARDKLDGLRSKLSSVERRLHEVLNTPPPRDTGEQSAKVLLETGEIPAAASESNAQAVELQRESMILQRAVHLQESQVTEKQAAFGRELARELKPAMQDVVKRIASGLDGARNAVLENTLIRVAVAVATGGHDETLPCFTYAGIQAPTGQADQFTMWLDTMRREGFEV